MADSYQEVIDERDQTIRLWKQANAKLQAKNRKYTLLMRAERSARMGWQQYASSTEKMLVDAMETIESITEASERIISAHQDGIKIGFKKEQDRIEREVEKALERERNGG
jgi:sugar-specific transcriptional regulator TrmB